MDLAAGIDFGGSAAKIGLVDRAGTILARCAVSMDPRETFEGIVAPVERSLRSLLRERGAATGKAGEGGAAERGATQGAPAPAGTRDRLAVIGIGTPGFIDKKEGVLIGGCENIPSLQRRSVQQHLAGLFSVPAFADNDGTCAAAGELAYGAARGRSHFALITVGTGIGGGLVLGGKVYRGWRGFAAEIGHLCVVPRGLWCSCGSRGCFEQYASGPAIARAYSEMRRTRGWTEDAPVTPKDIVARAAAGDECAVEALDEAGRWIAQAFGSILNILDLEACIVGGGISEAGESLLGPVRRHLPDHAWPQILDRVEVLAAGLRNDAGILGAAAQAWERLDA
jgi:glucokinase